MNRHSIQVPINVFIGIDFEHKLYFQRAFCMNYNIEYEREDDSRWLAEVDELPGVLAYGITSEEAMAKAEVLVLRVLAERLDLGERKPEPITITFKAALNRWP